MRRIVSIDGEIFAPEAATIPAYDRGFLYGDAVFETLRSYRGEPHSLDLHVARLLRSAERIQMPPLDASLICTRVRAAFAAAREHGEDDGYARIMVTRGSAPLGLALELAAVPRLVIFVEPLPPAPAYHVGVHAVTVPVLRAADGTKAAGAKVTNYLAAMLALAEAKSRGAQEAIVLDLDGRVIEGTTSNVFIVKGGVIRTPPEEVGLLAGITRATVLEAVNVQLAPLLVADLYDADEVFITSSIREVVGVVLVDGRKVGTGKVGDMTRAVHAAYRARLNC